MAVISWKSAVSGGWTLGSNWDSGTVPGIGDDATIGVAGIYTVALTASISVNSITISDTQATLQINNAGGTETVAAGFVNSGTLKVDSSSGQGGSSLTIGSTLSNSGVVTIGNVNLGAATTVTASGLVNTGTINLDGGTAPAALIVNGPAPATLGNVSILGDALLQFASGAVGGIASGEIFSLRDDATGIALNAGGVTTGTFSNAGTLAVDNFNNGFSGSGNYDPGGSTLDIGNTLDNSGVVNIGNTRLTAATTVTASGLVNTGTINLRSKASGSQATLNITGSGVPGDSIGFNTGAIISNADGLTIAVHGLFVNGSSGSSLGVISAGYAGIVLSNGASFANYGTITGSQVGAYLEPAGSTPGPGVTLTNFGLINGATGVIDAGPAGTFDTITNSGQINGTVNAGITLGGGTDLIVNFGTIGGGNGTAVVFGSGVDLVVLEPGAVLAGTLAGFGALDTLDLAQAPADSAVFAGDTASGTLTVMTGTAVVDTLLFAGQFADKGFVLSPDGQAGVDINLRALLGPVLSGTYGYAIIVTGANASTTVTATGTISASSGQGLVNAVGVVVTLTNMGQVTATANGRDGVYLGSGGIVTNGGGAGGGYIAGSAVGVMIGGGTGTVSNSGTVVGGTGVAAATGVTLTVANSGTIISSAGTAGTAVALAGGSSRLIVAPGAAFTGIVDGGGGSSVLEIAAPPGSGPAGLGPLAAASAVAYVSLGSVVNFGALQVDPSATLDGSGVLVFDTVINEGQINVGSGDSLAFGVVASAANTGVIDLQAGGMIDFEGAVANQLVLFQPPGGIAEIDHPEVFFATLSGFTGVDDVIHLSQLSPVGVSATFNAASDQLVVSNGIQSVSLQLDAGEDYTGISWQATSDAAGTGTDVTPVCFCRGTLILTERGEVPVETLAVGDRVVTLSGGLKPIVWIGFGHDLVTRRHSLSRPIVVRAGALADGVPRRDLYLTHGHALYLEGVLIPVEHLVNYRSICWDEEARVVEYYHVELTDHDVVFAEGAPAETYYDAGNRALFHNTRPGSEPGAAMPGFAPVLRDGEIVGRVWAALDERAGRRGAEGPTDDPDLDLVVDGRRLDLVSSADGAYTFALDDLPAGPLRLCSRSAVPSLVGLNRHDHRHLGVVIQARHPAAARRDDVPGSRRTGFQGRRLSPLRARLLLDRWKIRPAGGALRPSDWAVPATRAHRTP